MLKEYFRSKKKKKNNKNNKNLKTHKATESLAFPYFGKRLKELWYLIKNVELYLGIKASNSLK